MISLPNAGRDRHEVQNIFNLVYHINGSRFCDNGNRDDEWFAGRKFSNENYRYDSSTVFSIENFDYIYYYLALCSVRQFKPNCSIWNEIVINNHDDCSIMECIPNYYKSTGTGDHMIAINTIVMHPVYGCGRIIAVSPEENKYIVKFSSGREGAVKGNTLVELRVK